MQPHIRYHGDSGCHWMDNGSQRLPTASGDHGIQYSEYSDDSRPSLRVEGVRERSAGVLRLAINSAKSDVWDHLACLAYCRG